MPAVSKRLLALAIFLPLSTAIHVPRVHINVTNSLPRGVYVETTKPLAKGVLVIECLTPELAEFGKERGYLGRGSCPGNTVSVLKRIEGMPGSTVELGNQYVTIDGDLVFVSGTLTTDAEGREMPRMERGSFVLGPEEYFLMATNPRSWDDRYKGPTKRENIRATVRPWLTEGE